jgi:ketosteroid isomerase-like protein
MRAAKILPVLGLFLTLTAGRSAMAAQAEIEIEARNKEIVRSKFDAWAAGTGSPYELLTDEATWAIVGRSLVSKTYANRESFMREVIRPFNARMREGLKPHVRQITADGGRVVIFFDAKGVARDGQPYANTYAWFFEMRGGKIVNATAFFDSIAFNDLWQRVAPVQ